MVEAMIQNPSVDINTCVERSGVNSFWLAAFFGQGEVMRVLGERGIDVLNTHTQTYSNALHVSIERNYPPIVQMLVDSNFPLDIPKADGITPLIIACQHEFYEEEESMAAMLVQGGANINYVTADGQSALSHAINCGNIQLSEYLLRCGANIFNMDMKYRDCSPFFQAIYMNDLQSIEMFCDQGSDLSITNSEGMTPLILSA
jgi:ankyrin repeat protein